MKFKEIIDLLAYFEIYKINKSVVFCHSCFIVESLTITDFMVTMESQHTSELCVWWSSKTSSLH